MYITTIIINIIRSITTPLKSLYKVKAITIILVIAFTIAHFTLPTKSLAEDEIIDIVTELYENYESVDRDLQELQGAIKRTDSNNLFTPFSIGIKKKTEIEFISIEVDADGIPLTNHIYTDRDNNALNLGGRHLVFKGKLATGKHKFVLYYLYKDKKNKGKTIKGKASWSMGISGKPTHIELLFTKENGKIKVKPRKKTESR